MGLMHDDGTSATGLANKPTPTTRDRQKAKALIESLDWPPSKEQVVTWLMETAAQARQEGREDGWREGVEYAAFKAGQEASHLEHYLDDIHQADGARKAEKAIRALLTQPAPSGAKE